MGSHTLSCRNTAEPESELSPGTHHEGRWVQGCSESLSRTPLRIGRGRVLSATGSRCPGRGVDREIVRSQAWGRHLQMKTTKTRRLWLVPWVERAARDLGLASLGPTLRIRLILKTNKEINKMTKDAQEKRSAPCEASQGRRIHGGHPRLARLLSERGHPCGDPG